MNQEELFRDKFIFPASRALTIHLTLFDRDLHFLQHIAKKTFSSTRSRERPRAFVQFSEKRGREGTIFMLFCQI
jgi:hypothetical protein